MKFIFKIIILKLLFLFSLSFINFSHADNHNIYETLENIQNDLKTLERAVYSGSIEVNKSSSENLDVELDANSEDVLTRHLLKLSDIESQFQKLTNKFEEINFKLDKLSNRLSKVQADNQIRFQDLETAVSSNDLVKDTTLLSSKPKLEEKKSCPFIYKLMSHKLQSRKKEETEVKYYRNTNVLTE